MCLEHLLKAYRIKQASTRDLPCFSVFSDAVIRKIIESRPHTAQELAGIRGMSKQRCEAYGEDILRLVLQAPSQAPKAVRPGAGGKSAVKPVVLKHSTSGGRSLTKPKASTPAKSRAYSAQPYARPTPRVLTVTPRVSGPEDDVYILELAKGRVYVGKTSNLERRVGQVCPVCIYQ